MAVVSAKFEAGQVFLPQHGPWLTDFETELFAFPGSRHDDQCDSVSQALSETAVRFPMSISPEAVTRMSQPVPGARFNLLWLALRSAAMSTWRDAIAAA
jgi:hypothetical protein